MYLSIVARVLLISQDIFCQVSVLYTLVVSFPFLTFFFFNSLWKQTCNWVAQLRIYQFVSVYSSGIGLIQLSILIDLALDLLLSCSCSYIFYYLLTFYIYLSLPQVFFPFAVSWVISLWGHHVSGYLLSFYPFFYYFPISRVSMYHDYPNLLGWGCVQIINILGNRL